MSKSFLSINARLGLFNFFNFGKYLNCRIDSIIEHDPGYILFLHNKNKNLFEKIVVDTAFNKYNIEPTEVLEEVKELYFDDVPF